MPLKTKMKHAFWNVGMRSDVLRLNSSLFAVFTFCQGNPCLAETYYLYALADYVLPLYACHVRHLTRMLTNSICQSTAIKAFGEKEVFPEPVEQGFQI